MARHVVNPAGKPALLSPQPAQALPGGASGVAEDPNPVAHHVGGARVQPAATRRTGVPEQPQRRYKVLDGPRARLEGGHLSAYIQVMYDGAVTRITVGREYTEHQVDLEFLKRAGVKFEVIEPPAAPKDPDAEAAAE